ncbi:BAR adaptor protein Hob1 [Coemansia sp. RSA 552]|nr:BAR adaptor protein Hob1 [Coemansia sp. RSA 552]
MSWKGFKKALERMPHQLQTKIGRGSKTVDSEFDELQVRFVELERVTKELFQQTAQFRDGIRGMLVYQSAYLEHVLAMYRPISTDPDGNTQPVGSYTDEGASPELLRVAEEFRNRVTAIRESTDSRLGQLDVSIVGPIQELMAMMRNIHKVIQKRHHKLMDYDRYKSAVEKAEAKESSEGQRRLPEERAYQKHGAQYQEASRQYNYFNDMLKAELKQLLDLRQAFIDPVFMKFFRIQYDLYTTLFREFTDAARSCPALDLTTPVLAGWQPKWTRAEQNLSTLDVWGNGGMNVLPYQFDETNRGMFDSVKGTFRKKDKAPPGPATASSTFSSPPPPPPVGTTPSLGPGRGQSFTSTSPSIASGSVGPGSVGSSAPYGAAAAAAAASAVAAGSGKAPYGPRQPMPAQGPPPENQGFSYQPPAAEPAPPPVYQQPAAAPKGPSGSKYVRAVYDYQSQVDGDLNFRTGDLIELIQRQADPNDWWTGRFNGVTGVFPGTYVSDM